MKHATKRQLMKNTLICRLSKLMCASLCTADKTCDAYYFSSISGCTLGNAAQLVGANPLSIKTKFVHTNAALVPGIIKINLSSWLTVCSKRAYSMVYNLANC